MLASKSRRSGFNGFFVNDGLYQQQSNQATAEQVWDQNSGFVPGTVSDPSQAVMGGVLYTYGIGAPICS
jgi:hypothetical protein